MLSAKMEPPVIEGASTFSSWFFKSQDGALRVPKSNLFNTIMFSVNATFFTTWPILRKFLSRFLLEHITSQNICQYLYIGTQIFQILQNYCSLKLYFKYHFEMAPKEAKIFTGKTVISMVSKGHRPNYENWSLCYLRLEEIFLPALWIA